MACTASIEMQVRRTLSNGVFTTPKTAKSRRSVKLTESALDALRKHLGRQLEEDRLGGISVAGERSHFRHGSRHAAQPPQPRQPLLQTIARARGAAPEHPLSRLAPHVRHAAAGEGHPPENRPGTARSFECRHHPRHVLARAARNGRRSGRRHGGRPEIARWCDGGCGGGQRCARPPPIYLVFAGISGVAGPGFEPGTP